MSHYHPGSSLHFWRSVQKHEVDFILNDSMAIEVKGKDSIGQKDLKGLEALKDEGLLDQYYVVCREQQPRRVNQIEILPWEMFLEDLWTGTPPKV